MESENLIFHAKNIKQMLNRYQILQSAVGLIRIWAIWSKNTPKDGIKQGEKKQTQLFCAADGQ